MRLFAQKKGGDVTAILNTALPSHLVCLLKPPLRAAAPRQASASMSDNNIDARNSKHRKQVTR
jgi:hypothetical protein